MAWGVDATAKGLIIDYLLSRMTALSIMLPPGKIRELETAIPFDVGFPKTFFGAMRVTTVRITALPGRLGSMSRRIRRRLSQGVSR